jgi:hypothetical protein
LDQKTSLTKASPFCPTMPKKFQKQEMELSKPEMELFLSLLVIGSKTSLTKASPFGPTVPK